MGQEQWLMPVNIAIQEMELRRTIVLGQPWAKSQTLSENNLKAKRAGGMNQVVECLPSKCECQRTSQNTDKNYANSMKYVLLHTDILIIDF
jgi:hypothetical protein